LPREEAATRVNHGTGAGNARYSMCMPAPGPALEKREGWVRLFPDPS